MPKVIIDGEEYVKKSDAESKIKDVVNLVEMFKDMSDGGGDSYNCLARFFNTEKELDIAILYLFAELVERQKVEVKRLHDPDWISDFVGCEDSMVGPCQKCLIKASEASESALLPGYVVMPESLTAENGAKAILMGEFSVPFPVTCYACHGDDGEYCEECGNSGEVRLNINVPWTVIKDIYHKAVKHLAK